MFYAIFAPLRDEFIGFNLFRYISFRAALAAITAFLLALYWGPKIIRWLRDRQIQERAEKSDAPELQQLYKGSEKAKTPTLGGLLLGASLLASVLLWSRLDNPYVLLGIALFLMFGLIGYLDDIIKLRHPTENGISRTAKMCWLSATGLLVIAGLYFCWKSSGRPELLRLYIPFFKDAYLDLAVWGLAGTLVFFAFEWLVLAGTANAVNITDGMDGLATGCALMVAFAFAVISYIVGRTDFTAYLHVPYVPGCGEMAVFAAALAGSCLGFLWFNCYPAQIFLGDTGSLPLGGMLGYFAIVSRQELVLPVVGGIFFLEALSSYIQIFVYKRWKKRPFRIAPLHHVFQLQKVHESKIVIRFWILGVLLAIASVVMLKLR